ncbi:MAG TPA: DUF1573 domain-containing protein [Puia sp.]|nr:DUF1573 domain-containing protein [Puia sp.]
MKKIAIAVFLFGTVYCTQAQTASSGEATPSRLSVNPGGTALPRPADVLQLKENLHNFGKIPQGRPATYTFEIVNNGPVPLRLDNVQASCGCTTPVWSRDPIAAGATASILVGYNAYSEGPFTKTVTIVYNTSQTKTLTITGEVYKAPASSAPENASVQLLKQIN